MISVKQKCYCSECGQNKEFTAVPDKCWDLNCPSRRRKLRFGDFGLIPESNSAAFVDSLEKWHDEKCDGKCGYSQETMDARTKEVTNLQEQLTGAAYTQSALIEANRKLCDKNALLLAMLKHHADVFERIACLGNSDRHGNVMAIDALDRLGNLLKECEK